MCLILLAWRAHPVYPLVVAANRDEFFARPTAGAAFWPGDWILAGRDLQDGGTWMGITRGGRFAALTNYRDMARHREGLQSRGGLVPAFLDANGAPAEWLRVHAAGAGGFNGFNLLAAAGGELAWASNITGACEILAPGIHGLSNHLMDSPWPKVVEGRAALAAALPALPDLPGLLAFLRDARPRPDAELPSTGLDLDWERGLSPPFVRAPGYGTRATTLLLVDREGRAEFREQSWDARGEAAGEARFRFRLSGPLG